jgi:hypothetical protein
MKLVASMIVRNELGRYLADCVGHLLEFCDEVRVLDDGSGDGTAEWLVAQSWKDERIQVSAAEQSAFFAHEGHARQARLAWTFEADPTHVLVIDADEFVADGAAVRQACEANSGHAAVWTLDMEEVWELDGDCVCVREDGGWRTHPVPVLYAVPSPAQRDHTWVIADRALACGREPLAVRRLAGRARDAGTELLHFGWANKAERQARYDRYAVADGGRFHAAAHLQSIMWPDDRVRLEGREWPDGLSRWRESIAARVARQP